MTSIVGAAAAEPANTSSGAPSEATTAGGDAASKPPDKKDEPVAKLPDPASYRQRPAPVAVTASRGRYWTVEFGADTGIIRRVANGDGVHDVPGLVVGGHARVRLLPWLAARIAGRVEWAPFSFDDGALGLPSGTQIYQSSGRRVYLSATAEPTWSPVKHIELFAGVGIAWGRTNMPPLTTSGSQVVTLPTRGAVFVEVPFSLGIRYEFLPDWLVASVSFTVGIPFSRSGALLEPYRTPGANGEPVTVGGFPESGTSLLGLAGLGVLL